MGAFLLYIIKSSCCLIAFYIGYKALLSNETFFRFNRLVLLGGTAVCLLLPLVKVGTAAPGVLSRPVMELERVIMEEEPALPLLTGSGIAESPGLKQTVSFTALLAFLFVTGCLVNAFLLIRSQLMLRSLIKKGKQTADDKYKIVLFNENIAPFSYINTIIISEKDYQNNRNIILSHEMAHCRKRHFLDLLFMELVILLHWFNPVAWLLKRELRDVHEYEADMEVLKRGIDATTYQLLLVKKAAGSGSYTFANSFNHSKLKKRITMMLRKKSNNWARLKLALLVPVAAISMLAFARPEVNRPLRTLIPSEDMQNSSQNFNYGAFYFNVEFTKFVKALKAEEDLSSNETTRRIKKETNLVPLLINAKGAIMFNDERIFADQIHDKLLKLIQTNQPAAKPLLIVLQMDKDTPEETKELVWKIVGDTYASQKTDTENGKQPFLLLNASPRNFGSLNKSIY